MKYELIVKDNWNGETKDYDLKWDLSVEGETLIPDELECGIKIVTANNDGIIIHLNTIPARIDLEEGKTLWLHGFKGVKIYPEPYRSLKDWESHTIWMNPDLQLAEMIK